MEHCSTQSKTALRLSPASLSSGKSINSFVKGKNTPAKLLLNLLKWFVQTLDIAFCSKQISRQPCDFPSQNILFPCHETGTEGLRERKLLSILVGFFPTKTKIEVNE